MAISKQALLDLKDITEVAHQSGIDSIISAKSLSNGGLEWFYRDGNEIYRATTPSDGSSVTTQFVKKTGEATDSMDPLIVRIKQVARPATRRLLSR